MLGAGLGIDTARQLTASEPHMLAEAGCGFACRYVTGVPGSTLTKAEAHAISRAGLAIVSVFETMGNHAAYFTTAQGAKDGRQAAAAAEEAGQTGGHIFVAVGYDVQPGDLPALKGYLAAFSVGVGKHFAAGVYGSAALEDLGYPLWQAGATGWSGGRLSPRARIVQLPPPLMQTTFAGVHDVDVDVAMSPLHDLGWHLPLL